LCRGDAARVGKQYEKPGDLSLICTEAGLPYKKGSLGNA
jgi:hypothetical protein